MIYLITYDISSNAIRSKIAKRIIAVGYERMQFSVFIGPGNPKANKALWADLNKLLSTEPMAKFNVIAVTDNNLRNMAIIGDNELDIDFILGNKNTLFI